MENEKFDLKAEPTNQGSVRHSRPGTPLTGVALDAISYVNPEILGPGWTGIFARVSKEIAAAKTGFDILEISGWGPSATELLLLSIEHGIGGAIDMIKLAASVALCGVPNSNFTIENTTVSVANTNLNTLDHIQSTLNDIQRAAAASREYSNLPHLDSADESFLGIFTNALLKGYNSEILKNELTEHIITLAKTALGPKMKFCMTLAGGCLKTLNDLKCLEDALKARISLITQLYTFTFLYSANNALASALKPELKEMLTILTRIQKELEYSNMESSLLDFTEFVQRFQDLCNLRPIPYLLQLVRNHAAAKPKGFGKRLSNITHRILTHL
ncbi:hypothetical protein C8F04DRAFT_595751 [Mycena alexandri]|uniref:Uncharacterized protein n=1 Tax=Mycena alexandri TaxID=1745969 RepID=A0AAD6XCD8_9AGAR|nr:hypothetical protein C8F04DRAFT_595751 [Mycena alexandri]